MTPGLQFLGGAFGALLLACWYGPQLCRIIAAALLTHAGTVEQSREFRRNEWVRVRAALEVR